MPERDLRDVGLTLGGIVALTIGTVLPMFRLNPSRPTGAPVPLGYVLEQSTGIHGVDLALLLPAGIVGVMLVVGWPRPVRAVLGVLIGIVALVFSGHYLLDPTFGFDAAATFVPAPGWYGLVVGGALLFVSGGDDLRERTLRLAAPTTSSE